MASKSKGPTAPSKAKGVGVSRTASRHAGAKIKSGGGYTLNKRKEVPVRYGHRASNVANPNAVAELGMAMSGQRRDGTVTGLNTSSPLFGGSFKQVAGGNELAARCPAGPGGGREIYKTGYQSLHGKPVQGVPSNSPDVNTTAPGKRSLSEKGRVG
jgi:hypothetical protein